MSEYAHFQLHDPNNAEYCDSGFDGDKSGEDNHTWRNLVWEKGDTYIWYAGHIDDWQGQEYLNRSDVQNVFSIPAGTVSYYLDMNGWDSAYVQHNDNKANKYSQKSVHAPDDMTGSCKLSPSEAFEVHHN